ncbi:transmembrane protein, putative (macronuclear) [Tetrahymena thermophila SB210]|uniref:Transmembrane protein, putative n=1 Tax=Tetrahymena thermophila (strain SB210) TaxID=312017 RepID=W7X616_TETTS|nr:transmembrane protein, putative [Tetrahymena thermophila SB210]EWS72832.1 transmembrane protein, putative [Tetrahymena thermophila SB210]|eukprot:XP_012654623.1 transmembrane protein, putative [Tetrahymena thermophila SB210]
MQNQQQLQIRKLEQEQLSILYFFEQFQSFFRLNRMLKIEDKITIFKIATLVWIKTIQFLLVVLFFKFIQQTSYATYFLVFFGIDKVLRIIILYHRKIFIPLLILLVILQMEEVLTLYIYNRKDRQIVDMMYTQTVFINVLLIPQIIILFIWMYFSQNQQTLFIALPCILLLSFYINLVWVISFEFDLKEYLCTLLIFKELYCQGFQFVGFIGLIFCCRVINNYFFYLLILNLVLSLIMTLRFINSPLYTKGSKFEIFYYFLILFLAIFMNSGCDFRKIKQAFNVDSIKQFRVKNLNTFLVIRFVQTLYLLSIFIICISTDKPYSQNFKDHLQLDQNSFYMIVFVFSIASVAIQLKDIWILILIPYLNNKHQCFEIDDIDQLIELNNLQKSNQMNNYDLQFVSFFFPRDNSLIKQEHQKEFDFCLLFNFDQNIELIIPQVGERLPMIEDQYHHIVFFKRMIDIQSFQNYLEQFQITSFINQIQFDFHTNMQDLVQIIKLISSNSYEIIVKSENIPNSMVNLQLQQIQIKKFTILHYIAFDKNVMEFISINPFLAFYDLFEI